MAAIEDYALLGGLHAAALVGARTVHRLAVPAPVRLARLFRRAARRPRARAAGGWPQRQAAPAARRHYRGGTRWCWKAEWDTPGGTGAGGRLHAAPLVMPLSVVRIVEGSRGAGADAQWCWRFRFDYGHGRAVGPAIGWRRPHWPSPGLMRCWLRIACADAWPRSGHGGRLRGARRANAIPFVLTLRCVAPAAGP